MQLYVIRAVAKPPGNIVSYFLSKIGRKGAWQSTYSFDEAKRMDKCETDKWMSRIKVCDQITLDIIPISQEPE